MPLLKFIKETVKVFKNNSFRHFFYTLRSKSQVIFDKILGDFNCQSSSFESDPWFLVHKKFVCKLRRKLDATRLIQLYFRCVPHRPKSHFLWRNPAFTTSSLCIVHLWCFTRAQAFILPSQFAQIFVFNIHRVHTIKPQTAPQSIICKAGQTC